VVIAGKAPSPNWLNMDEAVEHCARGLGIWGWAGTEALGEGPEMRWWLDLAPVEQTARLDQVLDTLVSQHAGGHQHDWNAFRLRARAEVLRVDPRAPDEYTPLLTDQPKREEDFAVGRILEYDFLVPCVERVGEDGAQGDPQQPGDDPASGEDVSSPGDRIDQSRNPTPTPFQRTIQHGLDREVVDKSWGDFPVDVSQAIQGTYLANRVETPTVHADFVPGETCLTQACDKGPGRGGQMDIYSVPAQVLGQGEPMVEEVPVGVGDEEDLRSSH